jgi:hypothetical protein
MQKLITNQLPLSMYQSLELAIFVKDKQGRYLWARQKLRAKNRAHLIAKFNRIHP